MRGHPYATNATRALWLMAGLAVGAIVRLALFSHQMDPPIRLLRELLMVTAAAALTAAALATASRPPLSCFLVGFVGTVCSIGVLTVSGLQLSPLWFAAHMAALPVAVGVGVLIGMMIGARVRACPRP